MKAIEEILREIRELAKEIQGNSISNAYELLMGLAYRIEAAVKHQFRETTKTIPHEKVAVAENATTTPTYKDSLQVGDMAAIREALDKLLGVFDSGLVEYSDSCDNSDTAQIQYVIDKAGEALAKPPRNCDVFEVHKIDDEFEKAMGFPPSKTADERDELMRDNWFLFKAWLYAEAKGVNK
jgi:hypothetical protein